EDREVAGAAAEVGDEGALAAAAAAGVGRSGGDRLVDEGDLLEAGDGEGLAHAGDGAAIVIVGARAPVTDRATDDDPMAEGGGGGLAQPAEEGGDELGEPD